MQDPIVAKLHEWLREHEQDLLRDTVRMLRIPSIESEAKPNAPYGEANRKALDLALEICDSWGMKTTDLEGHLGYAEFGSGDRLIMSLGHLDVVPVGPGWKHEPFGAEIDGEYIYSRGATDDKGPTMAALYAMRAIQQCIPNLPARMRIAFGCDEESGFGCVERYMKTEEAPTYGVAPDSGWPLYHAEKGIADFLVTVPIPQGEFEILTIEGGQRPNIVIDSCSAKVRVADSVRGEVEAKVADKWDANVTVAWEGDVLSITAKGKAAHGSTPFLGDNAGSRALRFLFEIAPLSARKFLEETLLMTHPGGAGLGILGQDEVSEDLTSNMGIVSTENGVLNMLFNIRYPVTWKGEKLEQMCREKLQKLSGDFEMKVERDSPALYFPLDHPLVKTICEVYRQESGEDRAPGAMGGGTYARAIPNTVSIGTSWPGDGAAHETDERIAVNSLYKASRIYAHILYQLAIIPDAT